MPKQNTKVNQVVQVLANNINTFTGENPKVRSPKHIARELENRETLDQNLRFDRQSALDQMFPERTKGPLYEAAPEIEFDF